MASPAAAPDLGLSRWRYVAKRVEDSRTEKGIIEAVSADAAAELLLGSGKFPTSVTSADRGLGKEVKLFGTGVSRKDLAAAVRQLAALRKTGFPLERALGVIAKESPPALREAFTGCQRDLAAGSSLHEAMSRHPKVFPAVLCSLVEAGEAAGRLQETLTVAADTLGAEARIRSKIRGALTYPTIVFSIGVLVTTGLLLFVVPTFANTLSGLGGELPLITQVVLAVSSALRIVVPAALVAAVVAVLWYRRNKDVPEVREKRDALKLRVPVFRKILLWSATARFARTLAALQGAGVPLAVALPMAGKAADLYQIDVLAQQACADVVNGADLSVALNRPDNPMPSVVVQTLEVGEQSGSVDALLPQMAEFLEFESEERAGRLDKSLEPIILVVVGGMILVVALAMYAPILGVLQTVSNLSGS